MRWSVTHPQARAAIAATVLFACGAVVGVTADRWWWDRAPSTPVASPLTAAAMGDALDLDDAQRARVDELLTDLEADVALAAQEGPASLQQAARDARRRLEAELPPDRRDRFRSWMGEHHERMMDEMCGDERMRGRSMMHSRDEHHDENERHRRRWNH